MIKEYKISYNEHGFGISMEGQVRIDHAKADPKIKETLEFFAGTKHIIKSWRSETNAFLAMLSKRLMYLSASNKSWANDLEFVSKEITDVEGWCYVSPENGITITDFTCDMEIDQSDMTISHLKELDAELNKGGES